jgi:hypothetical protein
LYQILAKKPPPEILKNSFWLLKKKNYKIILKFVFFLSSGARKGGKSAVATWAQSALALGR